MKNDGYDNEDSDYILYVNDILGSEEAGHKCVARPRRSRLLLTVRLRNRYLILDVLGQGTFGQVVKCQNLKTQEVVAVKVIKNRTAYFNQSMMEVSVLDLVGSQFFFLVVGRRRLANSWPSSTRSSIKTTTTTSSG